MDNGSRSLSPVPQATLTGVLPRKPTWPRTGFFTLFSWAYELRISAWVKKKPKEYCVTSANDQKCLLQCPPGRFYWTQHAPSFRAVKAGKMGSSFLCMEESRTCNLMQRTATGCSPGCGRQGRATPPRSTAGTGPCVTSRGREHTFILKSVEEREYKNNESSLGYSCVCIHTVIKCNCSCGGGDPRRPGCPGPTKP